jgi:hypothetical protein
MKKYWAIDNCMTKAAAIWETPLKSKDPISAYLEGWAIWDKKSDYDKKNLDSFEVIFAEEDDEGNVDYDTASEVYAVGERSPFRVKGSWETPWYGGCETEYVEESQSKGILSKDLYFMAREYGVEQIREEVEEL